jgi:hypothetical protein
MDARDALFIRCASYHQGWQATHQAAICAEYMKGLLIYRANLNSRSSRYEKCRSDVKMYAVNGSGFIGSTGKSDR